VQELDRRGIQLPVLIGGAAINRRFGRRALYVEGERAYESGVFYCKDAFEGLSTMDSLQDGDKRKAFIDEVITDARNDKFLQTNTGKDVAKGSEDTRRSDLAQDHAVPTPPIWGG
jgi:5-methyltetrahydrofolate--homocysteine methyltransferase